MKIKFIIKRKEVGLEMDKTKIGDFIKELRLGKKMSQNDLAETISVTRQAVSQWERGINVPDLEALQDLSEFFCLSINELLIGKRLPKTKVSNEIEKVTCEILEQNELKNKKIKKLKYSFIIILFVFLFLFLLNYFVTFYKSIKVYTISAMSETFETHDGIFVTSKDKIYFRLGNIELKDDASINKVELYYLDDKEKKIIFSKKGNDVFIKDFYGYEEYFDLDDINYIKNNLYLKVVYEDKFDEAKIVFEQDFTNNSLFAKKRKNASQNDNLNDTNSSKIELPFSTNKMNCNDDTCELKVKKEDIFISYFKQNNLLYIIDDYLHIEWNYYIDNNLLIYKKYNNHGEEVENISIDLNNIADEDKNYEYFINIKENYIEKYL